MTSIESLPAEQGLSGVNPPTTDEVPLVGAESDDATRSHHRHADAHALVPTHAAGDTRRDV